MTSADGTNTHFLDGDGLPGCPFDFSFGLTEQPISDDLDALTNEPVSVVDPDADGELEEAVFFSLAPGSPTLATSGRSAADVLWTVGFSPGVYASAASLGLQPADDIDALCIIDVGLGPGFDSADFMLFSLAAGSPTLAARGFSAADVLRPGPEVAFPAASLGLRASDDLDALKCFEDAAPRTTVLVGDIWFCAPEFQGGVCETVIDVGDTVVWDFSEAELAHTTTDCGASCDSPTASPLWDSGRIEDGSSFQRTFNQPGLYRYYCSIHPAIHRGIIAVQGQATPTPTRTPTPGVAGDANCSGRVDSVDAAVMLQFIARLLGSLSCRQNADVNRDGTVDSRDVALVLQFVAGLLNRLPP
jgi:hypothetical protein